MDNDINMWKQLGETIQHGNPGDSLGAAVLLDSSGRNLVVGTSRFLYCVWEW